MGIKHNGEILLNRNEAQLILDIGRTTFYDLCRKGDLIVRAPKVHRSRMVTLDSVIAHKETMNSPLQDLSKRVFILEQRLDRLAGASDDQAKKYLQYIEENHPNIFK